MTFNSIIISMLSTSTSEKKVYVLMVPINFHFSRQTRQQGQTHIVGYLFVSRAARMLNRSSFYKHALCRMLDFQSKLFTFPRNCNIFYSLLLTLGLCAKDTNQFCSVARYDKIGSPLISSIEHYNITSSYNLLLLKPIKMRCQGIY